MAWAPASPLTQTGFRVERRTNTAFAAIATVAPSTTAYRDSTAAPDVTYEYRVTATSAAGDSSPSNVASTLMPPMAPTSLVAVIVAGGVDLSWANNSSSASGFRIERRQGTAAFAGIATIASTSPRYTDAGGSRTVSYDYRVFAVNASGDSLPSSIASTTVPPVAPSSITATPLSAASIRIGWTTASSTQTGFRIERAPLWTTSYVTVGAAAASATSFDDTSATPNTSFVYRVFATSSVGDSAPSSTAQALTFPAAPTNLASSPATSHIDLTWQGAAPGFRIERSPRNAGAFMTMGSTGATAFSDGSVTPATDYDYRVIAMNASGDSLPSGILPVSTPAGAPSATSVTPRYGLEAGGTAVTVRGVAFPAAGTPVTVTFGGVSATNVQLIDNHTLTCVTPPGDRRPGGVVDVTVADSMGQGTLTSGFTYALEIVSDDFSRGTLDPALEDPDRAYWFADGVIHGSGNWDERHFVRTVATDFADRDFIFEVTYEIYDGAVETLYMGLGSGTTSLGFAHPPADGFNFMIHNPSGGNSVATFLHHEPEGSIGAYLGPGPTGPNRLRVEKHGNRVTCTFAADFSGTFVPTFTYVVPNLHAAAPFFASTPSRLFFGAGWPATWFDDVLVVTLRKDPVTVSRCSPASGSPAGGTAVTLRGSGFAGSAPAVSFGGLAATDVIVVDDATLTCKTPVGLTSGATDIVVSKVIGSGACLGGYTVTGPFFSEDWNTVVGLNPNLEDPPHGFYEQNGELTRYFEGLTLMRTADADYADRDFTFDLRFTSNSSGSMAGGDRTYVGIGAGDIDSTTNEPRDAIFLRVATPDAGGDVDVIVTGGSSSTTRISNFAGSGQHVARFQRRGSALTITIDGISHTINGFKAKAPFLGPGTARLFFGARYGLQTFGRLDVTP